MSAAQDLGLAPASPAPLTPDQIGAMTPAQATATLAAMKAAHSPPPTLAPADAQDARARLDLLAKDPAFAKKLFSGHPDASKEFHSLVATVAAGNDVADAIAGIEQPDRFEITSGGKLPRHA